MSENKGLVGTAICGNSSCIFGGCIDMMQLVFEWGSGRNILTWQVCKATKESSTKSYNESIIKFVLSALLQATFEHVYVSSSDWSASINNAFK